MKMDRSVLAIGSLVIAGLLGTVLGQDPQRPMYHFLPAKNWMNDPNGLMYFNGMYHIFYQYNPRSTINQAQYNVWGHAASKNLVNWQYLPFAIEPDHPYDSNGCWTGSATLVNGIPTIVYTGINASGPGIGESQCSATPTDIHDPLLVNWTKSASNPLIPGPPANLQGTSGFRDPSTAWQSTNGQNWFLEVGCGNSSGAFTLLYESSDFVHWNYVHPLFFAPGMFGGNMFECPDFYNISDKVHVYKASADGFDYWLSGVFDTTNLIFVPFENKTGWYDYGRFYASKSFHDSSQNRQVVFGWSNEDDSENSQVARGWAGVQTLPRQITLNSDFTVSNYPISELQVLRGKPTTFNNLVVNDEEVSLNITQGDQIEISVRIQQVTGSPFRFGLKIRASPDNKEATLVYFDPPTPYIVNQDLPGNDFKSIVINAPDPGLCNEYCEATEQCFSWAYARPGDQGPSPMCFLKHFVPNMAPKEGTVSGIKGLLVVDRSNSTLATDADMGTQMAPLSSPPTELDLFIDHSIVEVFVNGGRSCLTSRIYPTLASSQGVSFFVEGGTVTADITVWELQSIW